MIDRIAHIWEAAFESAPKTDKVQELKGSCLPIWWTNTMTMRQGRQ